MPRWRRRRLARARRRLPRPPDDHSWGVRPLREIRPLQIPLGPAQPHWGTVLGQQFPAGVPVVLSLNLDFQVTGMGSLRVCDSCGQESIDGRLPADTCKDRLVRSVMES